jgi:alpha,alpha-trehalase
MNLARVSFAVVSLTILPLVSSLYHNGSVIAPCDSPIYCHGDLLREIELARPFADSKTFVDLYVHMATLSRSRLTKEQANHTSFT